MSNKLIAAGAVRSANLPEDVGGLPVLTDVLVASEDAQGRTLWLAWDERRVPVLTDEVRPANEPTLPRWARRRI
jgi:hypothetical protein